MQELSGRHAGLLGGLAIAADHHRRLRLRGSDRGIRDIEPDRRWQVRDHAQDRDRTREIEGGRATKAARAEEGSARRMPADERDSCRAGGAGSATGARERGKSARSPIASIDRVADLSLAITRR